MGRHRAPDETQEISVVNPDAKSRRVKAILVYCQPFYKRYRKSILAAASAAVTAGVAVYTDGITSDEWMFILIQIGAAIGVWGVPNATNKKVVKNDPVQ